jgi:hypothetical protein
MDFFPKGLLIPNSGTYLLNSSSNDVMRPFSHIWCTMITFTSKGECVYFSQTSLSINTVIAQMKAPLITSSKGLVFKTKMA